MSGERRTKFFWKVHTVEGKFVASFSSYEAKTVSESKVALEKTSENFSQKKAVPRFRKRLREYLKG